MAGGNLLRAGGTFVDPHSPDVGFRFKRMARKNLRNAKPGVTNKDDLVSGRPETSDHAYPVTTGFTGAIGRSGWLTDKIDALEYFNLP